MELLMHQRAVADVESIWVAVFQKESQAAADSYYTELISAIRSIQKDFTQGTSLESFRDGYRMLRVNDVRVFYRADQEDCIEVVRVLSYGSREIDNSK